MGRTFTIVLLWFLAGCTYQIPEADLPPLAYSATLRPLVVSPPTQVLYDPGVMEGRPPPQLPPPPSRPIPLVSSAPSKAQATANPRAIRPIQEEDE